MEEILTCAHCHVAIRQTDYFCFNCGTNLKPTPPSFNVLSMMKLFGGSILIPPMGLVWGFPYIRQPDMKSRVVGGVAMIITVLVFIYSTYWFYNYMQNVTAQVDEQMRILQGF